MSAIKFGESLSKFMIPLLTETKEFMKPLLTETKNLHEDSNNEVKYYYLSIKLVFV